MVVHKGTDLEDIETIEEYFEVFGKDEEALKYLIGFFLEQVFDLQEFLQDKGFTAEDFIEWQQLKADRQYH
ncbi:hypothetical protein CRP13_gp11 [Roseobacter phage CRP-13]|nr:hypothetical protein CRP13_gp11 [Roseobacter phage CRP-13]